MDPTNDEYRQELSSFGEDLMRQFPHAQWRYEALTGGVLSAGAKLPAEDYDKAEQWLTSVFGPPKVKEPWHPSHTKGVPPKEFKKTAEMEFNKMLHVNLISMMQRKSKRYTLLSWM